jgi:3-methyl-2-oxobutanoate hydroxymethyltransferase
MAGLRADRLPKFVKTYADVRGVLRDAASRFGEEVVDGTYPGPEHEYQ